MPAFILRRFLQAIIVMLVVALVAFSLFQYVGDPVQLMLGQFATPEDRIRLTHELGLDQPFYVQFYHFVVNAVHGQFGVSLRIGKPVSLLLAQRIPASALRPSSMVPARQRSRKALGSSDSSNPTQASDSAVFDPRSGGQRCVGNAASATM